MFFPDKKTLLCILQQDRQVVYAKEQFLFENTGLFSQGAF